MRIRTKIFSDFKDAKNLCITFEFFQYCENMFIIIKFLQENFCIKILFATIMRKGKGDPEPEAHKHTDPDTDPAQVHLHHS